MSDTKNPSDGGASVVALPVAPAWNGAPMTTVRVPVALVDMLKRMKPDVEFAMAVTLLVDESFSWAAQQQKYSFAVQENIALKQRLTETLMQLWGKQPEEQGKECP